MIIVALTPTVSAAARTERQYYNVGVGLLAPCDTSLPVAGGACFNVQPGDTGALLAIVDAASSPMSGQWAIRDAAGTLMGSGSYCWSATPAFVAIPPGAATLRVWVGATTPTCVDPVGTWGYIEASFF